MTATAPTARLHQPRPVAPKLGYLPGLDGMRAIAVGAVILYHANHRWMPGGFLGVEVFFVISGYLITLLLLAEHQRTDRIALGQFWLRRARRLLPALGVLLFGVALYAAIFRREELGALRGDLVSGLLYVTNWYQIWTGSSYFTSFAWVPLRHLWSLAVEEQFYLFWPLIMTLVLRRRRDRLPQVGIWFFGLAAAIAAFTALFFRSGPIGTPEATPGQYIELFGRDISRIDFLYLGTLTRASGVLLGAGLAMIWRPWAVARGPVRQRQRRFDVIGVLGLVGMVLLFRRIHDVVLTEDGIQGYAFLYRGGFFLLGLVTLTVIMAVTQPRSILGRVVLGNRVFVWIGQRSYGLYLYHWPIFQIYRGRPNVPLSVPAFVVLMAITVVIAELSYRFVEMPVREGHLGAWFRSLRGTSDRTSAERRRRTLGVAAAMTMLLAFTGVSVATAEVRENEIQASVEAGGEATRSILEDLGGGSTATTEAPTGTDAAPETTVAGVGPTTPTTVAPTTTAPPPDIDVYALGDSVMKGAAPALSSLGYYVDAEESRQFKEGVEILAYLKAAGVTPNAVVVHLGTNGPTTQARMDEMMAQLKDVPLVVFMTLRVPGAGQQDTNNALIQALPSRYPNVKVLDWLALSQGHDDWFYTDSIHLRPAGQQAYATLVAQALGRA